MDEDAGAQWDGGPELVALVVTLTVCGLLWRHIRDALSWWWHTASDVVDSGQVMLFALGVAAAGVAVLLVMAALARVVRLLRRKSR